MSKLKKLKQELKNADQAKVSTEQLRQRLNEIIARTPNADITYTQDTETRGVPTYSHAEWTGESPRLGRRQWIHDYWANQNFPRSVKITTNPLTKEKSKEYNPFGQRNWWTNGDPDHGEVRDIKISIMPTAKQLKQFDKARKTATRERESLIAELMSSKEFKDVHHLTNLRIVPKERQKEFRPRDYDTARLTVKSDPRLLVNMVNNLRQAMQRRGNSSAPIGRGAGDFFANILRRGE